MDLWAAIILGIVEGATEFLPVSSTGHLILTSKLLGMKATDFLKSFEIIIQLGAILSVVVLYWKSLLFNKEILKRVLLAFVPTGVLGLIFYRLIKKFLGNDQIVIWSLLLGGVFLIVFELLHKEKDDAADELGQLPYGKVLLIGLFQSIAMIPGVSRSAATIVGGLILGLKRRTIVEFSFLLAIPTMLAATGMDLVKNAHVFSVDQIGFLAAGFITSFIVAMASVKFLIHFIQRNNFIPFGVYRIVLVLTIWGWR
ncbi:MAG: undecaprenyl-diphosphatase UppP [Omnitrophica WOR_2 bacterium RIFCSPHIGHO2_01_FULL_48_9]|nr:MAG: undecaprenyl-diphosphatase UppP [Omnitrophica WOR_2 bacterium RIFCSPHIGHO2_02_FULL_48_11]OGX34012.1 MAG: undecaprenyl-diphosphatase UppP [Omnitrophica WOR_2 bacterium RIFCSPHIGHO2_01_FULL_48_9]